MTDQSTKERVEQVMALQIYRNGGSFRAETLAHYVKWPLTITRNIVAHMLRMGTLTSITDGVYAKPVDSRKWLTRKWASGVTPRPWRPL